MGHFEFGLNNSWAVKRFAEPEEWVEIAATKMEVKMMQFSLDLLDPMLVSDTSEYVMRTRDACRRYGVMLDSCFTGGIAYMSNLLLHPFPAMRRDAFSWYSKAIELSRQLGTKSLGGHFGAMSVKDFSDQSRRDALISELIERVESLSKTGLEMGLERLLWEPMPVSREPPSTIDEAQTLLKRLGKGVAIPVKLCIDVGHACNPNSVNSPSYDTYEWLRRLGADSPCVHLQQTDGKADRHWPFTREHNSVGLIEGKKVVSALDASGAGDVKFFLETFPAFEQKDDDVLLDLRDSVRYWKEFLD